MNAVHIETAAEVAADQRWLTTLHPDQLKYYELASRAQEFMSAASPTAGRWLNRAYAELERRRQGGQPSGPGTAAPPFKQVPPPRWPI